MGIQQSWCRVEVAFWNWSCSSRSSYWSDFKESSNRLPTTNKTSNEYPPNDTAFDTPGEAFSTGGKIVGLLDDGDAHMCPTHARERRPETERHLKSTKRQEANDEDILLMLS